MVNYLRRTPLDKVVGYIWGELKDGCIYAFTGAKPWTLQDGENELLTQDCKIVLGDEEFIFKLR